MTSSAENSTPVISLMPTKGSRRESAYGRSLRAFVHHRVALIALAVIVLIIATSMLASHLTTYDPVGRNVKDRMQGPSLTYPMGTDSLGRDVLTRSPLWWTDFAAGWLSLDLDCLRDRRAAGLDFRLFRRRGR